MKMGFIIDKTKCTGCKACVITCKDKCDINAGMNLRKVDIEEYGAFPNIKICYSSKSCHNCEDAPCIKNCPTGAMNRDNEFSIVRVDIQKCIGCGICVKACPFGAPSIDSKSQKSMKCDFCIDLLKEGQKPACVSVCNARALDFGEISELSKKYNCLKTLNDETKPSTLVIEK